MNEELIKLLQAEIVLLRECFQEKLQQLESLQVEVEIQDQKVVFEIK